MKIITNQIITNNRLLKVGASHSDRTFHMVKQQNEILGIAFADLGWEKYAERCPLCLSWLEWLECIADPYHPRKLSSAHFCKIRICPCCQKRRSFKAGETMLKVAEEALVRQPTLKFLFLTLTVPNVGLGD